METKAVITGDIIKSTRINPADRELLLNTIGNIVRDVEIWGNIRMEIFRGDSFQIQIDNPVKALRIAILVRTGLRAKSPSVFRWDARIALGLGNIYFEKNESVVESDGEAFHNSGWEFDKLGRSRSMAIKTPWTDLNDEFAVNTAFADDVIMNWTVTQAQVIYPLLLTSKTQKELAVGLDKTSQAISKLLIGGKANLIELYLNRYELLIKNKTQTL
jgi:hypothetical protein